MPRCGPIAPPRCGPHHPVGREAAPARATAPRWPASGCGGRRTAMMRGALSSPRRIRVPVLGTLLAAALLLGAAPAAWAGLLAPEGGSPNANMIATLYWVVFALGLVVFFVVDG